MSAIDALYVFDRFAPTCTLVLQHEWRSRSPAPPASLFAHYNEHPAPRPSLIYVPSTTPPTLLFSLEHSNLLFLSPATSEIEPLLVLEFLHRVVDVLEDYLGSPLMATKIEGNYDIIAQLLNEMADDGFPFITEPNALKDLVLPPSLIGKLFGSVTGLPSNSLPSLAPSSAQQLSTIPWRRSNVKHTNNELYVDLIELITATVAPSGRPLAARTNGTIAFTCKLSGVPDLLLTLQTPNSHKQRLGGKPHSILEYPVFHPCVRLSRWRDRPGELSFVPPDGKFVLASYEVDLIPPSTSTLNSATLQLPVQVEMKTAVGQDEDEFEVRVLISTSNLAPSGNGSSGAFGSRGSTRSPAFGSSSNAPLLEEVSITIPLPPAVKTLVATRCSRGEFHHEGREVVWKIPTTGPGATPSSTATFRTAMQIRSLGDDGDDEDDGEAEEERADEAAAPGKKPTGRRRRIEMAMPRCAIVNFSVKGWLASGVRVESLKVVGGRGIGDGVKPYKGVKYITRAGGIEVRC